MSKFKVGDILITPKTRRSVILVLGEEHTTYQITILCTIAHGYVTGKIYKKEKDFIEATFKCINLT